MISNPSVHPFSNNVFKGVSLGGNNYLHYEKHLQVLTYAYPVSQLVVVRSYKPSELAYQMILKGILNELGLCTHMYPYAI